VGDYSPTFAEGMIRTTEALSGLWVGKVYEVKVEPTENRIALLAVTMDLVAIHIIKLPNELP
jgi:hypothetical protein